MIEKIDAMGKPCPQPVILAKKALDAMEEGAVEVQVDNETSVANLIKFAENMDAKAQHRKEGSAYFVMIEKQMGTETPAEEEIQCQPLTFGGHSRGVGIGSARMGDGSDELGVILMKSLLYTISQTEPLPEAVLFFNGGVYLTTEGSPVIDDLRQMAENGVEIISCGTCLDYFGIQDKLLVGDVSNMYTIYETLRETNALLFD